MDAPEGAEGGAIPKTEKEEAPTEVKTEETMKQERQPTTAELLCLLLSIQEELRVRCEGHARELASARWSHEEGYRRLTERMDVLEDSARFAYGEVSRLSNMVDDRRPGEEREDSCGGAGGAKTLPSPGSPAIPPPLSPVSPPPPVSVTPPSPPLATRPAATQPTATSPTTPPPRRPSFNAPYTPPRRPRPQEFDGRVSLEAYMAQFELLAQAQAWDEREKAVQLAASLKGPAVEILGQLSMSQRASYATLVDALERRYGHQHQSEAYRARFRNRVRARDETLQQLAQDLEHLVRKAYPGAPEGTTSLLLRDQFVDALQDQQLQIYVLQAHVEDMQQALARALEFESFMRKGAAAAKRETRENTNVRRSHVRGRNKKPRSEQFGGRCWTCGQQGHRRAECPEAPRPSRSQSAERGRGGAQRACCWTCGQAGHLARSCMASGQGNFSGAGRRGTGQPGPPRPHSR